MGTAVPSGPAPAPIHPNARAVLAWMGQRMLRLQELVAEELARPGEEQDHSPASDAAIRAHLRFVAEGIAAHASPARVDALEAFASEVGDAMSADVDALEAELTPVGEATVFELEKQFGSGISEDEQMHATAGRRVRLAGWTNLFLARLDDALDASVKAPALEWMGERQGHLANTIFAMDRRAKELEIERTGPDAVDDVDVANRLGQAAMLQAHSRFLVEALVVTISGAKAR